MAEDKNNNAPSKEDQNNDEHTQKKQKDNPKNANEKSEEEKQKELEDLLKQLRDLQKQKEDLKQQQTKKSRVLMVEFGAIFHRNGLINFVMYYMLNLVIIYSLSELYNFFEFSGILIDLMLFVGLYTLVEIIFRAYIVSNHFRFVLRTFGFIFFFGYLTLFYFLEQYLFAGLFKFTNENLFVVFITSFILIRYVFSHLIRHTMSKYMRW